MLAEERFPRLITTVDLLFDWIPTSTLLNWKEALSFPYDSTLDNKKASFFPLLISHCQQQMTSPHNAAAMFRLQTVLIKEIWRDSDGEEGTRTLSNLHASPNNDYNYEMLLSSGSPNEEDFTICFALA
jgi:hypothetical protein